MDDRLTVKIVLSDDARYRSYELAASNLVSSWYDPSLEKAFTTTSYDDVPEEFKTSLIQHSTSSEKAALMYSVLTATPKVASTDKTFSFPAMPSFSGERFTIFWDVGQDDTALSTYDSSSPAASLCHTYESYGEHTIKFSTNVKNLQLQSGFERIKEIGSRSQEFQSLDYLYYCRNLERLKLNTLSSITTEWYDCYELTSIELSELEEIACAYSVNCMPNLKRFYAPRLKRISKATGVFKGDTSLEEISFPQLTAIYGGKGYDFLTNVSLTAAYLPKLESCLDQEFQCCVNLKNVDFSSLTAVTSKMFADCISLKEIKLPSVKKIAASGFNGCRSLKTIDISRLREAPVLDGAFNGLPADYEILVSHQLASKLSTAPNWDKIADHIKEV